LSWKEYRLEKIVGKDRSEEVCLGILERCDWNINKDIEDPTRIE
jgi:hypothetical protein